MNDFMIFPFQWNFKSGPPGEKNPGPARIQAVIRGGGTGGAERRSAACSLR
jgi:hypothetical protein